VLQVPTLPAQAGSSRIGGLKAQREPSRRWQDRQSHKERDMQALIWIGAALTLAGVCGLGLCVLKAMRARRAGLDDAAMRTELQKVVTLNLAALGVSVLGLMLVIAGIALG
jgi:hypothetical protein